MHFLWVHFVPLRAIRGSSNFSQLSLGHGPGAAWTPRLSIKGEKQSNVIYFCSQRQKNQAVLSCHLNFLYVIMQYGVSPDSWDSPSFSFESSVFSLIYIKPPACVLMQKHARHIRISLCTFYLLAHWFLEQRSKHLLIPDDIHMNEQEVIGKKMKIWSVSRAVKYALKL